MNDAWNILVPGPFPSTNHSYGYRNGKMYKKAGVEQFQVMVAHITKLARPKGWEPADRIRVVYDFHLNRKADCDNAMKAINDAIAQALGVDDDHFLPCAQSKTMGVKEPFVEIRIENVDAA